MLSCYHLVALYLHNIYQNKIYSVRMWRSVLKEVSVSDQVFQLSFTLFFKLLYMLRVFKLNLVLAIYILVAMVFCTVQSNLMLTDVTIA